MSKVKKIVGLTVCPKLGQKTYHNLIINWFESKVDALYLSDFIALVKIRSNEGSIISRMKSEYGVI